MAARRPAKAIVLLTERAIRDFGDIELYSIEQWGKRTAARYVSDLEAALQRICENPELPRPEQGFHASLRFYSVNKHVLVCDVAPDAIIVLTVLHGSMDIPSRLAELSPTLALETEMLHRELRHPKQ